MQNLTDTTIDLRAAAWIMLAWAHAQRRRLRDNDASGQITHRESVA